MNNKTILAITFLLAGTLLTGTSTMAMAPAAYAEEDEHDDDNKRYDKDDNKRYDKGGDGNKQKVEDESAGSIADCDDNEFERATQNCIATAATDDSVVVNGRDGDDDDDDNGRNGDNGNGDNGNGCDECFAEFEAAIEGEITGVDLTAVNVALAAFGDCDDEFGLLEVEALATALLEIDAVEDLEADIGLVTDLEECLDLLASIV
jgi:hypothetical protein